MFPQVHRRRAVCRAVSAGSAGTARRRSVCGVVALHSVLTQTLMWSSFTMVSVWTGLRHRRNAMLVSLLVWPVWGGRGGFQYCMPSSAVVILVVGVTTGCNPDPRNCKSPS